MPSVEVRAPPFSKELPHAIPHTPRMFHSYPGANYVLPSDEKERQRLLLQHKVLKAAYDGRILLAPVSLEGGPFILDSGSGSASWLLELSEFASPSSILRGIDIENRLFPHFPPANMSFSINSVTRLPQEWTNRFDLVNQRLLVAALQETEWHVAVKEIFRVLRPGGWAQLGEVGFWHAGEVNARLYDLVHALFVSRGLLLDCGQLIPVLLEEAGFVNITVEKRTIPLGSWAGQQGCDGRDNFINVFKGMKTPILRSGGLGFVDTEASFDKLIDETEDEWNRTEGAEIDFYIFIAQKPEIN